MTIKFQKPAKTIKLINVAQSPAVWGIGLTVSLILIGRFFFKDAVSSFKSWTGYFLFATFAGMLASSLIERQILRKYRTGLLHLVLIICGLVFSALTFTLADSNDATPSLLLVSSGTLVACFIAIAGRRPGMSLDGNKSPANDSWSAFLDNLLKLDHPPALRSQLASLLDEVWQAPKDQPDFFPSENQMIEDSLDQLDLAVRQSNNEESLRQIDKIRKLLNDRKSVILKNIQPEYQDVSRNALIRKTD